MGGLAYIIGGALQGVGGGMVKQAEADELERRNAALAAYRQEEIKATGETNDQNNARQMSRALNADLTKMGAENQFKLKLTDRSAQAQAAEREAEAAEKDKDRNWRSRESAADRASRLYEKRIELAARAEEELGKPIADPVNEVNGDQTLIFRDPKAKDGIRTVVIPKAGQKLPRPDYSGAGLYTGMGAAPGSDPSPPAPPPGFVVR